MGKHKAAAKNAEKKAKGKATKAKRGCPACVPDDKSRRKNRVPQKYLDKLNETKGTKIDWEHVAKEEGGHQVKGYIPWAECLKNNKSGVTVGTGVDIGQVGKDEYKRRINKFDSSKTGLEMSQKEKDDLYKKLDPYIGLKQKAACDYLKAHPLELTEKEADFLTMEAKNHHINKTMNDYASVNKKNDKAKTFENLSKEEQSTLLSLEYNRGNLIKPPQKDVAVNIGNGNRQGAIDAYGSNPTDNRIKNEKAYLQGAYQSTGIIVASPSTTTPQAGIKLQITTTLTLPPTAGSLK